MSKTNDVTLHNEEQDRLLKAAMAAEEASKETNPDEEDTVTEMPAPAGKSAVKWAFFASIVQFVSTPMGRTLLAGAFSFVAMVTTSVGVSTKFISPEERTLLIETFIDVADSDTDPPEGDDIVTAFNNIERELGVVAEHCAEAQKQSDENLKVANNRLERVQSTVRELELSLTAKDDRIYYLERQMEVGEEELKSCQEERAKLRMRVDDYMSCNDLD